MRRVLVDVPAWVDDVAPPDERYPSLEARMSVAVALARQNVLRDAGGPFGAAVFERDGGRLVAAGVNSVVRLNNSTLHAEVVALMMAEQALGSYALGGDGQPAHELVTSCEPCAMCLGATLWSGVSRLVCGAAREDAARLRFDEGPVFPESYGYLEARGVEVRRGILRGEAASVLELYRSRGGPIYNG
ncbi:MAG TPA: nucleoside deaminase [Gemmatimonadaceae bacterium]|nr:nucleoside deaminase [Gemmatimonadaceae bacterium]